MPTWKPIPFGPYKLAGNGLVVVKKPSLTDAEDAIVFLQDMEELTPFYLGDLWHDLKKRYPETYAQVLDHLTQTEGSLDNYQWVAESIPKSKRRFREGVPFGHHQAVAALAPKDRDEILAAAVEDKLKLSEVRLMARKKKRVKVDTGAAVLEGKFKVIYADPPWQFDDQGRMPDGARSTTADHYENMTTDQIAAWPVEAHALENSVLFLWVPVPLLPEAFPVIDEWGFTYKNKIVWSKGRHNMGHYVSNRHEDLLICTRGSCAPDRLTPMVENVQVIHSTYAHSEKPKEFRKIIERLYDGPYLELWSRHKVKGWTCWGDEVGKLAA